MHFVKKRRYILHKKNLIVFLTSFFFEANANRVNWDLSYDEGYGKRLNFNDVKSTDIDSFIFHNKPIDKSYLLKYRKNIDTVFTNLKFIGTHIGEFCYDSRGPAMVCTYHDSLKVFLITDIAVETVYNTLVLTSRQRAAMIITKYISTSIKSLKPMLNKEFGYVGIGISYGSKDFSDESNRSIKAEYVVLLIPNNKASQFINGNITEDELIDKSDVYLSDRDMNGMGDIKKIKIVLE